MMQEARFVSLEDPKRAILLGNCHKKQIQDRRSCELEFGGRARQRHNRSRSYAQFRGQRLHAPCERGSAAIRDQEAARPSTSPSTRPRRSPSFATGHSGCGAIDLVVFIARCPRRPSLPRLSHSARSSAMRTIASVSITGRRRNREFFLASGWGAAGSIRRGCCRSACRGAAQSDCAGAKPSRASRA